MLLLTPQDTASCRPWGKTQETGHKKSAWREISRPICICVFFYLVYLSNSQKLCRHARCNPLSLRRIYVVMRVAIPCRYAEVMSSCASWNRFCLHHTLYIKVEHTFSDTVRLTCSLLEQAVRRRSSLSASERKSHCESAAVGHLRRAGAAVCCDGIFHNGEPESRAAQFA